MYQATKEISRFFFKLIVDEQHSLHQAHEFRNNPKLGPQIICILVIESHTFKEKIKMEIKNYIEPNDKILQSKSDRIQPR